MSTQIRADPISTSEAVFQTVADREGVDPLELEPLGATIDPDALDQLFERDDAVELSFAYEGYHVTITPDGVVDVEDRPDGPGPTK